MDSLTIEEYQFINTVFDARLKHIAEIRAQRMGTVEGKPGGFIGGIMKDMPVEIRRVMMGTLKDSIQELDTEKEEIELLKAHIIGIVRQIKADANLKAAEELLKGKGGEHENK